MENQIVGYVIIDLAQQYVGIRPICPQLNSAQTPLSANESTMSQPPVPESSQNSPLKGLRVLTTRPESDFDLLREHLQKLGAAVVNHPLTEFSPPADLSEIEEIAGWIGDFSMLVFLSRRGVMAADSLVLRGDDPSVPIAAIGPGTRDTLVERGYQVDCVADRSNSESMAELLIDRFGQQSISKPLLILRGDRGSRVLPTMLQGARIPFRELVVYQSKDVAVADPQVLKSLAGGAFDWLTVSSSSIATNAAKLFGDAIGATKVASISPTTSSAAIDAGLSVSAEASDYNAIGLAEAIHEHEIQARRASE